MLTSAAVGGDTRQVSLRVLDPSTRSPAGQERYSKSKVYGRRGRTASAPTQLFDMIRNAFIWKG